MLRTIFMGALAALTCSALADQPQPTFSNVAGQPYTMTMPDGRQAVLKLKQVDTDPVDSKIKIIDNTCSNRQGMTCNYKMKFRRFFLAFVWTVHPDVSKIGQVVKRGYKYENQAEPTQLEPMESDSAVVAGLDRSKPQKMAEGLPAHELECDDFSWLPGSPTQAPASLHISRWEGEDNAPNSETGVTENRSGGGAYGIELKRIGPQTLRFESVEALTGSGTFDILVLLSTLGLSLKTPDGETCQVGLSGPGLLGIIPIYNRLQAKRGSYNDVPPYISGSDEVFEMDNVKSDFTSWFRADTSAVFE